MSPRTLVLASFSLFLATALRAQTTWKSIDVALTAAQAGGRLILLDLHASADADKKGDKWIADAQANPSFARVTGEMVLAVATLSPNLVAALPDLAQFRGRKRHLLLLDPWGGILLEPTEGFGDVSRLIARLNTLRQQAGTFILAGHQRRAGRYALSTVTWAGGLLDGGDVEDAEEVFGKAAAMAKRDNDPEALQGAQLSLAAISLHRRAWIKRTLYDLQQIVAHPATREIEASAWMVLGHAHRGLREEKEAITAYQHAFELAQKPSPFAETARRFLDALGSEPESEVRADVAAGNVHLLYPHRSVMVGSVDFGVATSDNVTRVELFLDDVRVAELTRRPFRAQVALGGTPHVHIIRAVALDAQERQLGEERITLNDRAVSLGVSIITPKEDKVASHTTIEVKPNIPEGRRLTGLDLYWNEAKIATLTGEPFRHELTLPSPSAAGYIRAVARDDSGATAEDVKLLNAAGGSERVGVDAVQVYAIVQDRGHYVDGLMASDFVVKEDGREVAAQVQSGKADPISIGLALDTSASMHVSMMEVAGYANEFVRESLGAADQTFVVRFDDKPELLQPLTSDRGRVTASIDDVQASGGTAILDAILYSLQQFRGVAGKRALVVFTDCDDNASSARPEGVLQYAREAGVPVYVVEIFSGYRLNTPTLLTGGELTLEKIAGATGGAFFRFARKVDLPRIFAQIRDDTRGEYLLTYVSPGSRRRDELRRISVEVPRRRVTVRATSGYYPR